MRNMQLGITLPVPAVNLLNRLAKDMNDDFDKPVVPHMYHAQCKWNGSSLAAQIIIDYLNEKYPRATSDGYVG